MAYDLGKINLTPFGKVVSTAGTEGMANIPALENKALLALERSKYWEDKRKEAADINADAALSMYQPKETSWGDVAMGVAGSLQDEGIFDQWFGKKPSVGTQVGNQLGDFITPSTSSSDGGSFLDLIWGSR